MSTSSQTLQEEASIHEFFTLVATETLALFEHLDFEFLTEYDVFAPARRGRTRDHEPPELHFHITNLPRKWFLSADIATIYHCRWTVELLFRELKTLYSLDEFDTSNPAVVEILLYAAVLTLLVSRKLLELVIKHTDDDAVFPPERWASDRKVAAQLILQEIAAGYGYPRPNLGEVFYQEAK